MKLIVGLGNPGDQYAQTPHNAGFMVLDILAKRFGLEWQTKFASLLFQYQELSKGGEFNRAIFLKPQLFMNKSGKAVAETVRFFKIKRHDVFVVHDELDLPLGALKLTLGRSAAGHKGVQSIITELGTQDFYRLRIGVMPQERPVAPDDYLTNVVLTADNKKLIEPALNKAADALQDILVKDINLVLNWVNRKSP